MNNMDIHHPNIVYSKNLWIRTLTAGEILAGFSTRTGDGAAGAELVTTELDGAPQPITRSDTWLLAVKTATPNTGWRGKEHGYARNHKSTP